jgi:hypothetical protein
MLFRGYLPIMSGWPMAQFFNSSGIRFRELKPFLVQNAERVKRHALAIAEQEGRPYVYLHEKVKKEDLAKQIAERDHIEECVGKIRRSLLVGECRRKGIMSTAPRREGTSPGAHEFSPRRTRIQGPVGRWIQGETRRYRMAEGVFKHTSAVSAFLGAR